MRQLSMDGQTDRQMWIDIYKVVSIILVIIGHLVIPQTLYNFIFSFHMYAFFFIAGVTFKVKKEQSLGSFVIENIKRLYIPYLFFAFAWDITNIVIESYLSKSLDWSIWEILKNIASVIIGKGIFESTASVGPSWFLLAFLVVRIVCWLLLKLSDNRIWVFGVVSIILFAVGYLVNGYDFLPFRLFSTLTAFLFMFIGYCCKKTYTIIKKTNLLLKLSGTIIAFSIALIMSMLADKPLVLASNILPSNPMITLVGGLAGCFGLLILAILIDDIILEPTFKFSLLWY